MKKNLKIESVRALEIIDSRGNPTIQVTVKLENNITGIAMVPSGASTGTFEAYELRDNEKNRYFGNGVKIAVENVNKKIENKIVGLNIYNQEEIDNVLIELDGTMNKSRLGANAILGVSLACCRAAAKSLNLEVFEYIGGNFMKQMPIPMMNILNGGKHSDNNLSIQEFMIVPNENIKFNSQIQMCVEIYKTLKQILIKKQYFVGVGDEGGFAPNLENEEEAIELILEAIEKAGYKENKDVGLALDIAATEMYEAARNIKEIDKYYFWKSKNLKTQDEMIKYIEKLCKKYPIISVEDGLAEEDWKAWRILNENLGKNIKIVGDDLFVTNYERLKRGIEEQSANSILIKLNQIGTLTETLNVINYAKANDFTTIISHRSGETEDTFIADLAVATNSKYIKSGAPCRSERVSKYNRLLNIYNNLILK